MIIGLKKVLTLFIAISIAIILPYSALPEKAKAAGATATSKVVFNFIGSDSTLSVSVITGTTTEATTFTKTSDTYTLSTLTTKFATDVVNKLKSPGGFTDSYTIVMYKAVNTGLGDELVILGKTGSTYKFGGMHKIIAGSLPLLYSFDDGNDYARAVNADPSRSTLGQTVSVSAATTQQYCSQTITLWNDLREKLDKLFGTKPRDNHTYWAEIATSSATRNQNSVSALPGSSIVASILTLLGPVGFIPAAMTYFDDFGKFYLTDEGVTKYKEIKTAISALQTSVAGVITGMGGDGTGSWPCTPSPKKINNDFAFTSENISSPAALSNMLKSMGTAVDALINKYSTTGGVDDTVSCPKIGTSNSKIFAWMFCQIGSGMNSIATWTLTKAFGFLTDALGTDMPIKDIFGSLDTSITSSPSAAK